MRWRWQFLPQAIGPLQPNTKIVGRPVLEANVLDDCWAPVSALRRAALLRWPSRRRMGALWLRGFKSPFASTAPHPSIPKSRTVAWAASRARIWKDGRWTCLLKSMRRRIGWRFASGQERDLRRHPRRQGLERLVESLRALHLVLVALEAAGGYETWSQALAVEPGFRRREANGQAPHAVALT